MKTIYYIEGRGIDFLYHFVVYMISGLRFLFTKELRMEQFNNNPNDGTGKFFNNVKIID